MRRGRISRAPVPLDGVMFGLSYNTMPHHFTVLREAWNQLRPGGRLVIMDAKLPPGLGGQLVLPFSLWLMKRTMLGNPLIKPWEDLARVADELDRDGTVHVRLVVHLPRHQDLSADRPRTAAFRRDASRIGF